MTSASGDSVSALVEQTLLADVADNLRVGLIVWSDEGTYLAANRCACDLTGQTREQLAELGLDALTGTSGDGAMRQLPLSGRSALTRADGSTLDVDWLIVETRAAHLPALASIFWPAAR
jgi:PAS domain-containing protein